MHRRIRIFAGGGQVALRVGRHFFGLRSRAMRELYSERNRLGWSVAHLPFGLRVFHRVDGNADARRRALRELSRYSAEEGGGYR